MKIDPTTLSLFTDSGQFLKDLNCPENKNWHDLNLNADGSRPCDTCLRNVYDTSQLTDQQVLEMVNKDPDTCLAVSPTQNNCTIVPQALQGKQHDIAR